MVDMCRTHLAGTDQKLRVIVPNIAKSAATLFALGADEILMGYLSELGPIDPQVLRTRIMKLQRCRWGSSN
jgi:ClpP class serine protease